VLAAVPPLMVEQPLVKMAAVAASPRAIN